METFWYIDDDWMIAVVLRHSNNISEPILITLSLRYKMWLALYLSLKKNEQKRDEASESSTD